MSLVTFSEVTRFHGRQDVLNGIAWSIEPGERVGLVGRNGAGKTTIIRLILGEELPDGGQISRAKGLKIGYLPQDVLAQADQRLLDLVLDVDPEYRRIEAELAEVEESLKNPEGQSPEGLMALAERQGRLWQLFESLGGWAREAEAKKILMGLGFREEDFDSNLGRFSGGWVMRAVLARILAAKPDLLVLDEPTNHLDLDSLLWLEGFLKSSPSALLLVSHDRVFLNNVASKIVELRRGRVDSYPGNYERFLAEKARRLATESAAFANQQDRIKQMERFIERNRVRATTARRAQSRIKALEKIDRLAPPESAEERSFSLKLPQGKRGPDLVAEFSGVSFGYGPTKVYQDLNLTLTRGQRLALLGPNGRGKSTLAKLLAGVVFPDEGKLKMGQNVDVGYFSQFQMDNLNGSLTVIEELAQVAGHLTPGSLRSILGGFLFSGDDVFKKVSVLSGGEKTRLVLAKIMMGSPNLLILDEPTNHLDIPGRQMLEDALEGYEGTLVLISHDRHFINKLCDAVAVVENGSLTVFPGDFDDYQSLWRGDLADLASQKSPAPKVGPDAAAMGKKEDPKDLKTGAAKGSKGFKDPKDQNARKKAQEARKLLNARRRPLERLLAETEGRLGRIAVRAQELEAVLGDAATYQDGEKVKLLTKELAELSAEKLGLEETWEKTARELEAAG
ncbi:MAG: ABC-F family ATP-binding cassette domain-containing protein [Deltaproteobacteria bacterium]|jgi:ATP-binding cassette subfamily F protein 3|nr:ABC-F family ATP-binding cassette domain-containing protein [Deltaproteobacteria bacterium]